MKRLLRTALIATLLLVAAVPAHAKKACVVVSKRISPYIEAYDGIVETLGKDVVRFDLDGQRERGGKVVEAMRGQGCDVIVPIGSLALDIVRLQIKDKPVVYTMVASSPAALKSAPNVAGINIETPASKFLTIVKKMLPNASRVGIVYNPAYAAAYVAEAEQASSRYGLELITRSIASIKMLPNAAGDLVPRVDVLMMVPDPTSSNRKAFEYMLLESARRGMPLIGLSKEHVRDGALFSFTIDCQDVGRKTGEMVRRAYDGIGSAKAFRPHLDSSLVINEKAAKRLGLRIDPALKNRAADVYQ